MTARDAARQRAGFLFVVAATILWGTSATLARWTMKHDVPPLVVVELRLSISVVLLAIGFAALFWMIFEPPARIAGAHYDTRMWGLFLAIALGSALVPFGLFYAGLARLAASRAGIVALLEPIVAIGSAALFLHEGLSMSQSLGALLILVGVGLASRAHAATLIEP